MYRHGSGALVFGSGTVQWPWGLDPHHDTDTGVPPERANGSNTRVGVDPHGPDRAIQQATVNLFADMGVQPTTLEPGLVPAVASTDATAPLSTIAEPGTPPRLGAELTLRGTASDAGGGVVAAVEVSFDGGERWHPAEGRSEWSYTWVPDRAGTVSIRSRAVDDSGNLETPGPGVEVTVSGGND